MSSHFDEASVVMIWHKDLFPEGGKNENFVLSPFSAHNALSQILAGSQANTETQLQNILGNMNY